MKQAADGIAHPESAKLAEVNLHKPAFFIKQVVCGDIAVAERIGQLMRIVNKNRLRHLIKRAGSGNIRDIEFLFGEGHVNGRDTQQAEVSVADCIEQGHRLSAVMAADRPEMNE